MTQKLANFLLLYIAGSYSGLALMVYLLGLFMSIILLIWLHLGEVSVKLLETTTLMIKKCHFVLKIKLYQSTREVIILTWNLWTSPLQYFAKFPNSQYLALLTINLVAESSKCIEEVTTLELFYQKAENQVGKWWKIFLREWTPKMLLDLKQSD